MAMKYNTIRPHKLQIPMMKLCLGWGCQHEITTTNTTLHQKTRIIHNYDNTYTVMAKLSKIKGAKCIQLWSNMKYPVIYGE